MFNFLGLSRILDSAQSIAQNRQCFLMHLLRGSDTDLSILWCKAGRVTILSGACLDQVR